MRKSERSYAETFKEALRLFLNDCDLRNLRPFFIRYYQNEIQAFLNQLEEQGIDTKGLKPYSLTENISTRMYPLYAYLQRGKGCFYKYPIRGLRLFFNFLYKKKHIPRNPMENINLLKDRKHVIHIFSKEQLNPMFNQPDLPRLR